MTSPPVTAVISSLLIPLLDPHISHPPHQKTTKLKVDWVSLFKPLQPSFPIYYTCFESLNSFTHIYIKPVRTYPLVVFCFYLFICSVSHWAVSWFIDHLHLLCVYVKHFLSLCFEKVLNNASLPFLHISEHNGGARGKTIIWCISIHHATGYPCIFETSITIYLLTFLSRYTGVLLKHKNKSFS